MKASKRENHPPVVVQMQKKKEKKKEVMVHSFIKRERVPTAARTGLKTLDHRC